MTIYKIGRIGTKDWTVEEADDSDMACLRAGWAPEWCAVYDITNDIKVGLDNGDIEFLD